MELDHKVIRITAIALLALAFLNSAMYGPGRGMCLVPPDEEWSDFIAFTEAVTFLLLLIGTSILKKCPRASTLILTAALTGRIIYELKISVLKELWALGLDAYLHPMSLFFLVTYYVAGFILPALWVIDSWNKRKTGKA